MTADRRELLRLMKLVKQLDPAAYEALLADGWRLVAEAHQRKTPDEIAAWMARAA